MRWGANLWTVLLASGLAIAAPRGASAANDLGLTVDQIESVGGILCVSFRVAEPFTPRLEDTLLRGMPATVTYEVGVWKRRTFWFDKLVLAIKSEHKVVYDPWSRTFRIRSGSYPPRSRTAPDLDSLRSLLFDERRLPLAEASSLDSTARYYASVKVLIQPLSTEDLGEVEHWLAGEVRPPEGSPKGVPEYLMSLAVNLSGLGDRSALVKGPTFVPALLPRSP